MSEEGRNTIMVFTNDKDAAHLYVANDDDITDYIAVGSPHLRMLDEDNIDNDDEETLKHTDGMLLTMEKSTADKVVENMDTDSIHLPVVLEEINPNGSRYWVPNVMPKPYIDQNFSTIDAAFDFYKTYASNAGFEVRKSTGSVGKDGTISQKYFLCSKEGAKRDKICGLSMDNSKKRRNRPSIRTSCEARLFVKLNRQKMYIVYDFIEKHNHTLVDKRDSMFLRVNRQLTYSQKQLLHDVSNINMGPCKAFKVLKQTSGGYERVGATTTECKNFKRCLNSFIGDCDAQMVVEKLTKKMEFLTIFFFDFYQLSDGSLGGLFWADDVANRNFTAFEDVVGFDVTFRTNKYSMIFISFTGVDNHKRCVNFGAGMLSSESIDAYSWLLTSFKRCFGSEPKVLITDQDPAIKQATPNVFSQSRHRLCVWHISDKFTEKVGSQVCKDGFLQRINDIVWSHSITPLEFEERWSSMIREFNLENNNRLLDMYEIRHRCILPYFHDWPMSGLMRTTSRSEGENYIFGLMSNSDLHLIEFVGNFDAAMEAQRVVQQRNDNESRYTQPELKLDLSIENQASQIYTRAMFLEVQVEMIASMKTCMCFRNDDIDGGMSFTIEDIDEDVKVNGVFQVEFIMKESKVMCSCKHFERYGTLCRHAFYALRFMKVHDIPEQYINRRWTKGAVPPPSQFTDFVLYQNSSKKDDIQSLVRDIHYLVDHSIDRLVYDFENLSMFRDKQKELFNNVEADTAHQPSLKNKDVIESFLGVSQPDDVLITIPSGIRNKGCGSGKKRLKSTKEIATIKAKKPLRLCSKCGVKADHDARNCHKKKETVAAI